MKFSNCEIVGGGNYRVVPNVFKNAVRVLRREKKWWLIPLLITVVVLGAIIYLTQSPEPVSPFMYSR